MRGISLTTACVLVATLDLSAQLKPATQIVAQPDSPVSINSYSARYERRSQYATEGIHHELQYVSKGDKPIVAIQFGLVSFDVWNEFLDRTNGVSMEAVVPGKPRSGGWIATAYGAFSFQTGVAYVNRVRFDDGSIWTADQSVILSELRKIESDFDANRLKSEPTTPKP